MAARLSPAFTVYVGSDAASGAAGVSTAAGPRCLPPPVVTESAAGAFGVADGVPAAGAAGVEGVADGDGVAGAPGVAGVDGVPGVAGVPGRAGVTGAVAFGSPGSVGVGVAGSGSGMTGSPLLGASGAMGSVNGAVADGPGAAGAGAAGVGAPKSVAGSAEPVPGTAASGREGLGATCRGEPRAPGSTSAAGPSLTRPDDAAHSGHAWGPCEASTRSPTAICWDRLARSGRFANSSPCGVVPLLLGELEPAVGPAAGVGAPGTAALTLGDAVPRGGVRCRGVGGREQRQCQRGARDSGGYDQGGYLAGASVAAVPGTHVVHLSHNGGVTAEPSRLRTHVTSSAGN